MTPQDEKRINDRFERIETDLETIAGYVLRHEEQSGEYNDRFAELTKKMSELAEAQKHTDERLNIVIGIVERYFSDGRK
jgi:predicted  nucleic acid-binding Zn-ribbon protein